ncbi:hypothetical protein [Leuconostoc mesenteroides]|uniref:hypothetical protein n=1 Tax=Leuconostoc mesenteroides TaxID=1245 RepID=UPI0030D395F6
MRKIKLKSPDKSKAPTLKMQSIYEKNQHTLRLSFNFSFLTNNNDYNLNSSVFTGEIAKTLFNRISYLSQHDVMSATAKGKKLGLELVKNFGGRDKIGSLKIHEKFGSERTTLCNDGYWIFRLCPNNNPYESRVLGKIIDHTFYIMFIDCNHVLYAKRK